MSEPTNIMTLIYIGEKFYRESRTMMSSLYHEDGHRADWGKVNVALREGREVHIRPANAGEMAHYEHILATEYPATENL